MNRQSGGTPASIRVLRAPRNARRLLSMKYRIGRRGLPAIALPVLLAGCRQLADVPTLALSVRAQACSPAAPDLLVLQAARVDCANGGSYVRLTGDGATYLVIAQLPTANAADDPISYRLSADTALSQPSADRVGDRTAARLAGTARQAPTARPHATWQSAVDAILQARGRALASTATFAASRRRVAETSIAAVRTPPPLRSVRSFHVLANFKGRQLVGQRIGARLIYVGAHVLVYEDTLAPAGGFTWTQVNELGQYFDQYLYPIDTVAFGPPTDVDDNGRVIVLMSPVVNADTPRSTCVSQGYITGFFNPEDFSGAKDTASNHGEVFYTIVPDPVGRFSCPHSAADMASQVPATFLHEMQHLISYSQHVVAHGGAAAPGWLDEGLSLVAEELGSIPYERECPPPNCRTDPQQLFPDSSQGFVVDFAYDSYVYARAPDTASLTLHADSGLGVSWRGGDWALMRWLGDQMGSGFYRALERGPSDGIADIEAATGQAFPTLFANFGLALYTDSLPGLPRTVAPAADRFVTRNLRQLWTRWASPAVPQPFPLALKAVNTDTALATMHPGAMAFYRLNTPLGVSTVTLTFAGALGQPLDPSLLPQLSIFRLPPGQ